MKTQFIKATMFFVALWTFSVSCGYGQQIDYKSLSQELCKLAEEGNPPTDEDVKTIYDRFEIAKAITGENYQVHFNTFQLLLARESARNCPKLSTKGFTLSDPEIVDTDSTFADFEVKEILKKLRTLKESNNFELLIITTNDYFPFQNKEEFASDILHRNSNKHFMYHAALVINRTGRNVRFATTNETRALLTDEYLQQLIDDILIPNFKEGNYLEPVNTAIDKISFKTKR